MLRLVIASNAAEGHGEGRRRKGGEGGEEERAFLRFRRGLRAGLAGLICKVDRALQSDPLDRGKKGEEKEGRGGGRVLFSRAPFPVKLVRRGPSITQLYNEFEGRGREREGRKDPILPIFLLLLVCAEENVIP